MKITEEFLRDIVKECVNEVLTNMAMPNYPVDKVDNAISKLKFDPSKITTNNKMRFWNYAKDIIGMINKLYSEDPKAAEKKLMYYDKLSLKCMERKSYVNAIVYTLVADRDNYETYDLAEA